MSQILSTQLHNVVISANIGIMIFFTVIVAPTVFKVLPAQWSAKYVRAFFRNTALNIFQLGLFCWLLMAGAK
jgi:hypothetical protein